MKPKTLISRKIIEIDEEKCNGCGLCIPNCREGALQIVDGKARLVGDQYCDGLGACLGHCPQDAIRIVERPAEVFDEDAVKEKKNKMHPQACPVTGGCPSSRASGIPRASPSPKRWQARGSCFVSNSLPNNPGPWPQAEGTGLRIPHSGGPGIAFPGVPSRGSTAFIPGLKAGVSCRGIELTKRLQDKADGRPLLGPKSQAVSELINWPVQLSLVPVNAPYLRGADILLAADCAGFSLPDFHARLLKGRVLIVACPKLDDAQVYVEKLAQIFQVNDIRSLTIARMEVPCCGGLSMIVEEALARAGKEIPVETVIVTIEGVEKHVRRDVRT